MNSKQFLDENDFGVDEQWPISPSGSNLNHQFQYSDSSSAVSKYPYPSTSNFLFNPVVGPPPPPYAQQGRLPNVIPTINDQSKWQVNQMPSGGELPKIPPPAVAMTEPASSVPKSRKPKKVVDGQQGLPPPPPSPTLTEDNGVTPQPADSRFLCDICLKYFGTKGSLKTHTRVHTGERPFPCPVKGCPRAFTQQANCTRHVKLIHKDFAPETEVEDKEEEKKKGRKKKEEAKKDVVEAGAVLNETEDMLLPPVRRVNLTSGPSRPPHRFDCELPLEAMQEIESGKNGLVTVTNFSSSSSSSSTSSYADGPAASVSVPQPMQKQPKKKGRPSNADKTATAAGAPARKKTKKSSKEGEVESGRLTVQSAQPPMYAAMDGYGIRSYPGHNLGHHMYQMHSPTDEFHNEQRLFSPVSFEFDPPAEPRGMQIHHDHNYIAANTQSPTTYNGFHPIQNQMYYYGPSQMNAFNFGSLPPNQVNASSMLASPPPSHTSPFQPSFFENFLPEEITFDLQHS